MKGRCMSQRLSVFPELKADFEPCGPTRGTPRLANATQIEIVGRMRRGGAWERIGSAGSAVGRGAAWRLKRV